MGERAAAEELAGVARAVAQAERAPSDAAILRNRERVRAWLDAPGTATEVALLDGGGAAAVALGEVLPEAVGESRFVAVRLLALAGGVGRAVAVLGPSWRERPARIEGDLEALLAAAPLEEVRVHASALAPDLVDGDAGRGIWTRARLGLEEGWVRAHPHVLRDLHEPRYAVRRAAFDLAVAEGQAERSPLLVAYALRDPAALLRRDAVGVAARAGFRALLRLALSDEAWIVRGRPRRRTATSGRRPRRTSSPWSRGTPRPRCASPPPTR
jgi:hypothetical protein